MATMTTKENFPVIDITHRPKRMQSENLKSTNKVTTAMDIESPESYVPTTPTLERAIEFYESHAEGEYRTLYLQTAKWLREFMSKSIPTPAPDGVDIDKAQELLSQARRGN